MKGILSWKKFIYIVTLTWHECGITRDPNALLYEKCRIQCFGACAILEKRICHSLLLWFGPLFFAMLAVWLYGWNLQNEMSTTIVWITIQFSTRHSWSPQDEMELCLTFHGYHQFKVLVCPVLWFMAKYLQSDWECSSIFTLPIKIELVMDVNIQIS